MLEATSGFAGGHALASGAVGGFARTANRLVLEMTFRLAHGAWFLACLLRGG